MNLAQIRRDIHKFPEIGFTEFRTASKVVEFLQSMGYEVKYGDEVMDPEERRGVPSKELLEEAYRKALQEGANKNIIKNMRGGLTGVVGTLRGRKPGPTVAFRFDMDALPIRESLDEDHFPQTQGFRSLHEGNMHACGHDGHTTIGLGLAEAMTKANFSGTLKLIFQPAEEGVRGAYAMMRKGIVDDVDVLFCFHLGMNLSLGEICGGTSNWFATTKLLVNFHGVSSHAGVEPESGKNALLGAATALLNIHALPRFGSAITRVNVGNLEGGSGTNIIPDFAKMTIETRASSSRINKELEYRIKDIIKHSAAMHGLKYDIEKIGEALTIKCDPELISIVLEEAKQVDGFSVFHESHPGGGSEDASFFMKKVQENGGKATYMLIGTPTVAQHHNGKFDIQEDVLPMAVELLERLAKKKLLNSVTL